MHIVGERINTSRKAIAPAVEGRDAEYIQKVARDQVGAGADRIDVNAGTLVDGEPDALAWLVQTVQDAVDAPLCLDSPNPAALAKALPLHKGKAMINSISAEKERYRRIVPLVKEYGSAVVGLCMDDEGLPDTADRRVEIAHRLISDLADDGIPADDIYIDPLVRPISTSSDAALVVLETLQRVHERHPAVHFICGLSNVSFGLPARRLLNQAFLVLAMGAGLDGAILDPQDAGLMSLLRAAEALLNRDSFGLHYIQAFRDGKLAVTP
ncbi:MAG: methyltetrahydrofolate cobalamin methyltransferase [Firmicutes bacterium]|nr:methyltetrahydrofolate cobalamin methyltransferase [Bacillota bacterium]